MPSVAQDRTSADDILAPAPVTLAAEAEVAEATTEAKAAELASVPPQRSEAAVVEVAAEAEVVEIASVPEQRSEAEVAAPKRRRRSKAGLQKWSGETKHLQVRVPRSLQLRYLRLAALLRENGDEVAQRSWLAGLLYEGPQNAAELKELIESQLSEAREQSSGPVVVVGGMAPIEMTRRYRSWIDHLLIDENFEISMTEVVLCLMHQGPQTPEALLELSQRWALVAPRKGG
jgi:hypothetical protein